MLWVSPHRSFAASNTTFAALLDRLIVSGMHRMLKTLGAIPLSCVDQSGCGTAGSAGLRSVTVGIAPSAPPDSAVQLVIGGDAGCAIEVVGTEASGTRTPVTSSEISADSALTTSTAFLSAPGVSVRPR